jgi:hypothetical protein
MGEMYERLEAVVRSSGLQAEVIAWQNAAVEEHFARRPLRTLQEAMSLKAKKRMAAAR